MGVSKDGIWEMQLRGRDGIAGGSLCYGDWCYLSVFLVCLACHPARSIA